MDINANLSVLFVGIYNKDKSYIPFTTVAKKVMLQLYDKFVSDGSISRIEDLNENDKKQLVSECRSDNKFYTNETLIQKSKVLHLINQINMYS